MSSDDDASHGQESVLKPHGPEAEKKKRTWTRGSQRTPAKRAKQFQDLRSPYGVQGNSLWCMACSCAIGFKEKSTAKKHLESDTHKDNVKRKEDVQYVEAAVCLFCNGDVEGRFEKE